MCPIEGIRFKSTTKDDFDLCETCVKKAAYADDTHNKIEQHVDFAADFGFKYILVPISLPDGPLGLDFVKGKTPPTVRELTEDSPVKWTVHP